MIWGHEHRMAIYDKSTAAGISIFARCVGHGGMPVELNAVKNTNVPLQYYDARVYQTYDNTPVGFNGFVNINLEGNIATLDYRDVDNNSVLRETFTTTGTGLTQRFNYVHPALSKGNAAPKVMVQASRA